jgi:hypothetical protein
MAVVVDDHAGAVSFPLGRSPPEHSRWIARARAYCFDE